MPHDPRAQWRAAIHELLGLAATHAGIAQTYCEIDDDTGLAYALRKFAIYAKHAVETFNDLSADNRRIAEAEENQGEKGARHDNCDILMKLAETPIVFDLDFRAGAKRDERGAQKRAPQHRALPNLANVAALLREQPAVADCFAYDLMLGAALVVAPLPSTDAHGAALPSPVEDIDATRLQEWLQCNGFARVSKDTVHQAIDLRARERSFHPVREHLAKLAHDGKPRLGQWLSTYLGVTPSSYASAIGEMFLVSMVARVQEPGCKADHMLVLEGPQGSGKSSACAILGGRWFSDNLPDVTLGKEAAQHLAGKWLIEIAEMSALGRAEEAALKAFISRPTERYRPSYGRREISAPRQCVFIGTTNRATYLRDPSGARRTWPVEVAHIDLPALARDRDQLLAEALVLYRAGRRWWPDAAAERALIRPEQEARFEADAWEETIAHWLVGKSRATVGEIARAALYIETARLGTADQRRIVAVLEREGWRRLPKDRRGNRFWAPTEGDGGRRTTAHDPELPLGGGKTNSRTR